MRQPSNLGRVSSAEVDGVLGVHPLPVNVHLIPRDPSTFSEGTRALQTYITVPPITF